MLIFNTDKEGFDTQVFYNDTYLISISRDDIETFKTEFNSLLAKYAI